MDTSNIDNTYQPVITNYNIISYTLDNYDK